MLDYACFHPFDASSSPFHTQNWNNVHRRGNWVHGRKKIIKKVDFSFKNIDLGFELLDFSIKMIGLEFDMVDFSFKMTDWDLKCLILASK